MTGLTVLIAGASGRAANSRRKGSLGGLILSRLKYVCLVAAYGSLDRPIGGPRGEKTRRQGKFMVPQVDSLC